MSRPKIERKICTTPPYEVYKPNGVSLQDLEIIQLLPDEWEALYLFNKEGLDQTQGAKKMGISQSTFQRILCSARKKLSLALLDGKAIQIQKTEKN